MLFSKKCTHNKVPIDKTYGYCPDCGELIENQWYLVRCASCGLKIPASSKKGIIIPANNYCHHCGASGYTIERIDKIDCVNINYAVLVRTTVDTQINEITQSWSDVVKTCEIPEYQQLFLPNC